MTEIKDFDAILAEQRQAAGTGPVFRLLDTEWHCLASIPAWKLATFTATNATFMDSIEFLVNLLVPEERERFSSIVKEDDVSVNLLNSIVGWLMEAYGKRPLDESKS